MSPQSHIKNNRKLRNAERGRARMSKQDGSEGVSHKGEIM